jgi:hypothetical protein
MNKSKQQQLVDITFEIAFTIRDNKALQKMGNEELAEWVARQLRLCGFPTQPMGCSWGVLIDQSANCDKP